ncbi:E3 ubiquitin-protein ligase SIAH1B-like [Anoplophora glabripennis]|uniref:E3 ubiquitin-protein ligase SIAH1B-like n=1 Tax=Anoplophora glabripennis TaxID=217634 RepID=UPI000875A789|nr:E3 ubiquitin-protein ligase SIAH1B-like [Anoplophora glabripennis]
MIFVPSQSLSKLVCVHCKNHLSYFPIYFHREKGSFCGRCPIPDDSDTVRNEVYESIAQSQKFPCRYNSDGCTEHLIPEKIPQHEKCCPYAKCQCPALVSETCKWEGFTKDLHDHYEDKHPTFLLRDGQFEVDFVNSHEENCLLPYGEDFFIVNRSSDPKSNIFSCTVNYYGTNCNANTYTYKMILENERRSRTHVIKKKLNTRADVNMEGLRNILDNPSSVVATIILECPTPGNVTEEDNETSAINYELLKELECTVCLEYMLPPIHQCLTGHSLCLKCKNSVKNCPTCQQEFKDTQNFTLAKVINHITYPCKNRRCRFTAKARDIKKHEASCIFSTVKCPLQDYEDCHADIIFQEMYDHVVSSHSENLLEMETVNIPFEEGADQDDEDCYIIRYAFRLFKLHYKYQHGEFCWAMQLIGSPEDSAKYMFDIDVLDNSGNNRRAYFRSVCSPLSDGSTAFDDNKSFIYIDYDQIRFMITTDFTYRVRVMQG